MTATHLLSSSFAHALTALRRRQRPAHPATHLSGAPHLDLAVERALRRFAACYGGWSDSLFDRHFLQHRAVWILAAFTAGELNRPAAAVALAAAWDRQFGDHRTERRRQRQAELVPAAADFLGWVTDELVRPAGDELRA